MQGKWRSHAWREGGSLLPVRLLTDLVFASRWTPNPLALQVGDGKTDFAPTPAESRNIVRESYSVASTLLVQFSVDSFDQTDEMAAILAAKYPSGTRVLRLPGTHTSPLGQDFDIQGARGFGPAYVGAMVAKAAAQLEQRRLGNRLLSWMSRCARLA